jgi:hypothetical protein
MVQARGGPPGATAPSAQWPSVEPWRLLRRDETGMRRWRPPMASSRHLHRCQPREVTAPFSSSPSWSQLDGRGHPASRRPLPCSTHTAPAPFPSSHRWQVGWADMYPIMGYSGPIRIGPSIKIISIFFGYSLDTYPRRIGYISVSDTCPTRIRVPGDILVLHRW